MGEATTTRITCTHDCPDACSAIVTVEDGRAVAIRADESHPVTGRHLCGKVDRYLERVYSPDRLLTPLRRTGPKGSGKFEPIGWDEAVDQIVDRWTDTIDTHGAEAILPYAYLGAMGALTAFGPGWGLFQRMGASQLHRAICGGQQLELNKALGGAPQADPELFGEAKLIVLWGADLVSTSIHTWDFVRAARAKGARLVVIDPYRSQTALRADDHLRIRPGTDGALALGLGHVIIRDSLADDRYIADHTSGFDAYREAVAEWTPEATSGATGLDPEVIIELARASARTTPTAMRIGVGMQRATGAGMAVRAIQCLPTLTGQWRHRGGGILNARTVNRLGFESLWSNEKLDTRMINMIQLGRALTDPDLAPPIKALFVWNSNPAIITADQNRVIEGLSRTDLFTVVHDLFVTDTARYADIVLPAPSMIEQTDLIGSWGYNYVSLNRPAIEPLGAAKSNAEVTRLLAARLGYDDGALGLGDDDMIRRCLDESSLAVEFDQLDESGFVRTPHPGGVTPHAEGGFGTESSRFEFDSATMHDAFGKGSVPRYIAPAESPETRPDVAERFPLRLLTLKRHHSINSSYGNLPVLLGAEPEQTIELQARDAETRGLADGARVKAWNDLGSVEARLVVTDRVTEGCVAVPFGRWLRDGPSANALTSDRLGDFGGGPTFCDNLVEVSAVPPLSSDTGDGYAVTNGTAAPTGALGHGNDRTG